MMYDEESMDLMEGEGEVGEEADGDKEEEEEEEEAAEEEEEEEI